MRNSSGAYSWAANPPVRALSFRRVLDATPSGVKERPILFSGPMVRAILEGRKTQTRRVVTPQPNWGMWPYRNGDLWLHALSGDPRKCPYGVPGDRLYVREMLRRPDGDPWLYEADMQPVMVDACDETAMLAWAHHKQQDYCTSMFMPRWASRITLELTDVRVQRVQEISEEDAVAEGIEAFDFPVPPNPPGQVQRMYGITSYFPQADPTAAKAYRRLWASINGKRKAACHAA
jgi:hypothetical protein